MSTEEQVKAAKNPQEALLAIARGIDSIAEGSKDAATHDPWGDPWVHDPGLDLPPTAANQRVRAQQFLDDLKDQLAAESDAEERQALEARIRLAKDGLREIQGIDAPDDGDHTTTEFDGEHAEVEIPVASEEGKALRAEFVPHLGLDEDGALSHAYVEGGPMWLYLYDRDFVMGLPDSYKRAMVDDLSQYSPTEALELGRDILKDVDTAGPEVTMEAILHD